MSDRRNRKREEAGSGGPARPHRLEPVSGLVMDGPFAETKERVLAAPATRRVPEAPALDRPCPKAVARWDAS